MIAIYGHSPGHLLVRTLISNVQEYTSKVSYNVIFICVNLKSLTKEQAFTELQPILEELSSDLYMFTGVLPIGTIDLLNSHHDGSFVKLTLLTPERETNSKTGKLIVGGIPSSHELFTQYLSSKLTENLSVIYSSSLQSEICHLQENVYISSIVSSCGLLNSNFNEVKGLRDNHKLQLDNNNSCMSDRKQRELSSTEWIYSLRILEIYFQEQNIQTYLLNSLRRELALNKRKESTYILPYADIKSKDIYFHDVDQPFGYLSNFSDHPIFCQGQIWRTVEHYYQAQKFHGIELEHTIRMSQSPVLAKEIAWNNSVLESRRWADIKKTVMLKALKAKFNQHYELKEQLISTGNRLLCEYSSNDKYWGDPGDGTGQNTLGELLMVIRTEFNSTDEK